MLSTGKCQAKTFPEPCTCLLGWAGKELSERCQRFAMQTIGRRWIPCVRRLIKADQQSRKPPAVRTSFGAQSLSETAWVVLSQPNFSSQILTLFEQIRCPIECGLMSLIVWHALESQWLEFVWFTACVKFSQLEASNSVTLRTLGK